MQIISNYHRSSAITPCTDHELIPYNFPTANGKYANLLTKMLGGGYVITNIVLIDIAFGLGHQI